MTEQQLQYSRDYRKRNRDKILSKRRKYYQENKEKMRLEAREFYQENLEVCRERCRQQAAKNRGQRQAYNKAYFAKNKAAIIEKRKDYYRNRRKNDLGFKLAHYLRCRITKAIGNNQKAGSAVKDLGCSIDELKAYLESKFQAGMTWDNYGEWHIDHIKPLASFNLTNREDFLKAAHYTNLQPLWAEDNLRKNDSIAIAE